MKNIAACVTLQNTCRGLISYAQSLRDEGDQLYVLHVALNGTSFMGAVNDAQTLEYLYTVSQEAGADMTVLHSDNVLNTIADFVADKGITHLVLGAPSKNTKDNGIIGALSARLGNTVCLYLYDKQKGELIQ